MELIESIVNEDELNDKLFPTCRKGQAPMPNSLKLSSVVPYSKLSEVFCDEVSLKNIEGAIVFCELGINLQHTGIYIGNNKIIELNGDGYIKKVSIREFLNSSELRTGNILYTFTDCEKNIIQNSNAIKRAKSRLGEKLEYNIAIENCHKFTYGCITGEFDNFVVTFDSLKSFLQNYLKTIMFEKVVKLKDDFVE